MTEDEHPEITSEDFTLPAAKPGADFYWTVQREVMNAAREQGTEIRERKIWKDSSLTTRYAEPAAGIALARQMKHTAERVEYDYIRYARQEGMSWAAIGEVLQVEADSAYDRGTKAFDYAVGPAPENAWSWDPMFSWHCPACDEAVTDRGPYESHPEDNERGHGAGCTRFAAEVAAWQAERDSWDAEDGCEPDPEAQ